MSCTSVTILGTCRLRICLRKTPTTHARRNAARSSFTSYASTAGICGSAAPLPDSSWLCLLYGLFVPLIAHVSLVVVQLGDAAGVVREVQDFRG